MPAAIDLMRQGTYSSSGRTNRAKTLLTYFVAFFRILVGWHFLYEGTAKLLTPK
jgi:hypothetical protein